jgi:hypothetical protein
MTTDPSLTDRVRRYRERNPRFEFYPSPDVLQIIRHYQDTANDKCIAGILDGLIRAGHRAVTGNGRT